MGNYSNILPGCITALVFIWTWVELMYHLPTLGWVFYTDENLSSDMASVRIFILMCILRSCLVYFGFKFSFCKLLCKTGQDDFLLFKYFTKTFLHWKWVLAPLLHVQGRLDRYVFTFMFETCDVFLLWDFGDPSNFFQNLNMMVDFNWGSQSFPVHQCEVGHRDIFN